VRKLEAGLTWAHGPLAQAIRNAILGYVLGPIVGHYTHPRVIGREVLDGLCPPVVFAANHSSHLDTPVILGALPAPWRRDTAVVAAADYFYRNALVAGLVSLAFGAVPIERRSGLQRSSAERLGRVLASAHNLLVYPEGTRSRDGSMGILRSGAARLAVEHKVPLVPIAVRGTHAAMPPGRLWPTHHPVAVRFGSPICPERGDDHKDITVRLKESLGAPM
jgi:1-acyl-sn-glycerol-3-phosphate acyltransferase